jgi:hypothetical protein
MRRGRAVVLILLLAAMLASYLGALSATEDRIARLANDPGVATAFRDHETGRTDALIALMAFTLLTPIAAAVIVVLFVLLVKMLEALFVSLHVPSWFSSPVVGVAAICALYATSHGWIPAALYGVRLAARAYVVYVYGPLPVIR